MLPHTPADIPETLCAVAQPGTALQNISQLLQTLNAASSSQLFPSLAMAYHGAGESCLSTPKCI